MENKKGTKTIRCQDISIKNAKRTFYKTENKIKIFADFFLGELKYKDYNWMFNGIEKSILNK